MAALAALDRRSVLDAVERLRDQSVEGIIVIAPQTTAVAALANVPKDVPLVAVGLLLALGAGATSLLWAGRLL